MSSQPRGRTRPAASDRLPVDAPPTAAGVFRQEGQYWTIEYAGTIIRIRDGKGLRYLAFLLRHPGQRFEVNDLLRSALVEGSESDPTSDPERVRLAVTKRVKAAIRNIAEYHSGLGYHLSAGVKTGAHCVYLPDPERRFVWKP
jgi:hypothetical protein